MFQDDRVERLREIRLSLRLTQAGMADKMGMPTRTYEDIEAGRSAYRPIHMRAAMMAAFFMADACNDGSLIPSEARGLVEKLAQLLAREADKTRAK